MKTHLEYRVTEKWANKEYGSSFGQPMCDPGQPPYVRKIVLDVDDPMLEDFRSRLKRDNYKPAVIIEREYTTCEMSNAQLFHLIVTECFDSDACGEDYKTEYDDINACPKCGAGRIQLSSLKLDLSLAKTDADIVRTIAMDELIVSQRFVDVLLQHNITGYTVNEVEHVGDNKPKGRWYQLNITGHAGHTINPTRYGLNYFDDDVEGKYTCPEHLLSGLKIVSEVYVNRNHIEDVDIALTSNRIGIRSGVLMPTHIILISKRLYDLLIANKISGYAVEIAHIL